MSNEVTIKVDLDTGGVVSGAKTVTNAIDGIGKGSEGVSGKAVGMWTAVGNVVGTMVTKAFGAVSGAMDKAIAREDTLKNFPKVMQSLGYETDVAERSISAIKEHLDGLPSSTQAIASFVQQLTATTGNLDKSTKLGLAFNDMMLAGGANTEKISNAQRMFNSMLASGKPDMEKWLSLVETAPGQMDQLAKSMLGTEANQNTLREAIKNGTVSFDDLCNAVIRLDTEGGNGIANFEQQARAATGGIGTALENVQNRIAAAVANVLDAIGQENISGAIDAFSKKFSDVAKFIIGIIDSIKENFDFSAAEKAIGKVVEAFTGSMPDMKNVASMIGEALARVANVIVKVVDAVAPFLPMAAKLAAVLLLVHGPAVRLASAIPRVASAMSLMITAVSGGSMAANKMIGMLDKVAKVASGPVVIGIMAAVAAIAIIATVVGDAIERQKEFEKATDGLREACGLLGDSSLEAVGGVADMVKGLGQAAAKAQGTTDKLKVVAKTTDELVQSQGELADKIQSKFSETETTNATLGVFAQKIAELAGNCDGSAEKLSELQSYLNAYNEIAGTSYKVTDDFSGALDISTDKLLENAEAFKARARAAAAQEMLVEQYKAQFEIGQSLAEATAKQAQAQEGLNKAVKGTDEWDYYHQQLIECNDEVARQKGLLEANKDGIDAVADAYVKGTAAANSYASGGIAEAISANAEMRSSLESAGFQVQNVSDYFADLGLTAEQAANLTADQAVALAQAWDQPVADVIALCQQMGIEVPASLQGAMSAADAVVAAGGTEAAASWVRSMTAGQYQMVAAAASASGMSVAEFVVSAQKMGASGAAGVANYAQGILNGSGQVSTAATSTVNNASTAAKTAASTASVIGNMFSAGAANGINVTAMVANAVKMVQNAIDAANKKAETASPSRVMRRFGRFFSEGAALGVGDEAWMMAEESSGMASDAIAAAADGYRAGALRAVPKIRGAMEGIAQGAARWFEGASTSAEVVWPSRATGAMVPQQAFAVAGAAGGMAVPVATRGDVTDSHDTTYELHIDGLSINDDDRIRTLISETIDRALVRASARARR